MAGAGADHAGAHTCPECGRRIVKTTQLRRTRRFWRLAVFGLSLVIAGAGTWATPMLRAQHWQRHAPSTLLVMLADADSVPPIDETWSELFIRAHYGQLSVRHRTIHSERLAKRVLADEPPDGGLSLQSLYLINQLRPGRSQALAERMSMLIAVWEKRRERSQDDDEPLLASPRIEAMRSLFNRWDHKYAIAILGQVGSEEAVETLSASLRTWGNPNRDLAAIALGRIGGDEAIDALTEVVADGGERVALAAAVALALIGEPAGERAEPAIVFRIKRPVRVRERVVLAACLSVLRGEEAHISIPLMRLYMEAAGTERLAHTYISMLDEDAMPCLPLVMSYLDDEDPARIERALYAIAMLGSGAAEALPVLDEMAANPGANQSVQVVISRLRRPD